MLSAGISASVSHLCCLQVINLDPPDEIWQDAQDHHDLGSMPVPGDEAGQPGDEPGQPEDVPGVECEDKEMEKEDMKEGKGTFQDLICFLHDI